MIIDQKLLAWYKKNSRDLPWRKTRDAYKILVSEVMLQQTQVPRVLLYYKKWLKQFPTWKSLSVASNSDVIKAWAGLGYNRRALALRDIARSYVGAGSPGPNKGGKTPPLRSSDWIKFKGIGPYTAAALAVFTHAERTMPIDTNIRRVLDRVLLGVPYPDPTLDKKIHKQSVKLLAGKNFDLVPQALFDLATSVCKKIPDCAVCPLRDQCKAAPKFLKGSVRTPKSMTKKSNETIHRNKKYPDRIFRGRILKLAREAKAGIGPIRLIGPMIDPTFDTKLDTAWLNRVLVRLEKDQLVKRRGNKIFLAS